MSRSARSAKAELTREALQRLALVHVLGRDLDFSEVVEDVELGEVERVVAVDERGVLHDDEVEPAATSTAASRGAVLAADFL